MPAAKPTFDAAYEEAIQKSPMAGKKRGLEMGHSCRSHPCCTEE
jgi:hypothetical protein